MIINIEIKNRIANYVQGENTPVCGNSEDSVRFVFDAEWSEYPKKTARFFWGNQYHEEEFEGDTCKAPMFLGTKRVLIGVYAGESADGEPCIASTKAEVTYLLSARCTGSEPSPGTGENYTNEAKGAAIQATEAAELATAAADRAEAAGGLKEFGSLQLEVSAYINGSYDAGFYAEYSIGGQTIRGAGCVYLEGLKYDEPVPPSPTWAQTLIALMGCKVAKFSLDLDGDYVYDYVHLHVYDSLCEGTSYIKNVDTSSETVWHTTGEVTEHLPRIAVYNGVYGATICAEGGKFLQLPKQFISALANNDYAVSHGYISGGMQYTCGTLTITGYN